MLYAKTILSGPAKLIAKENGVAMRELHAAMRTGYEQALMYWHAKYRPLHFQRIAYKRYGYTPRAGEKLAPQSKLWKRSYTGRKWAMGPRLVGEQHTNPLVFTGRSRTLAAIRDIRATRNGGRAVIHARALNWRNPKSPIDMRAEMTTLNEAEQTKMVAVFAEHVSRAFGGYRDARAARRASMVRDKHGRFVGATYE